MEITNKGFNVVIANKNLSSALSLRSKLNIDTCDINANHILNIYESMPRISDAADFSILDDILPEQDITKSDESVVGVIVETREHHALETVVLSVVQNCKIPVQLFHGKKNLNHIISSKIGSLIKSGQVILTALNTDGLKASAYNALMLSPKFLKMLLGRNKILVFQSDSLVCDNSEYSLSDFISFDYIGGCWNRNRPVGLVIDGGNGGFSLRDWNMALQCLSQFPPDLWGGGEDGYYAFHLQLMGGKVASEEESAQFATQDFFKYKSLGAHKIAFLEPDQRKKFFEYCPTAKHVFPNAYASIEAL